MNLFSRIVAVATCLSFAGCSFLFSKGPPPNYQRVSFLDCSTSVAPPVLDTLWAGLNGLGALAASGKTDEQWQADGQKTSRSTVLGVGVFWFVISGFSAIYGYKAASDCKDATSELMNRPAPRQYRQSWPPPPPSPPREPQAPTEDTAPEQPTD